MAPDKVKEVDPMIKVKHKTGHLATQRELDVIVKAAQWCKFDEAWIGPIVEAKNAAGKKVHVYKDLETGHYNSLKTAVRLIYEGTTHFRDVLCAKDAAVFYLLLYKLGILKDDPYEWWHARFASSMSEIEGLKDAIREEDALLFRYRPKLPIKQAGICGPAYMDVGGEGPWRLSTELWYAMQHGINAELYCHSGEGGLRRIFIEDGWKMLDEPMESMREFCDPEQIVSGTIRKFNNKKGKAK